jgi:DNA-binding transcriptional LysR family regulator
MTRTIPSGDFFHRCIFLRTSSVYLKMQNGAMGIRELRTFVAVAERGSLSAAAETLFLSLPAVSAQVASLENEVGSVLFDRSRKPARLNAAGHTLLVRAREILSLYEGLGESIADPAAGMAGSFALGSIPTALTSVIPKALKALRAAHPRMQIKVHHGLSPSFAEMLRQGEMDAAIISEPRTALPDISWAPFADEPVMVIAPSEAKGTTDGALLQEYPYIRFNRHFWVSQRIEDALVSRRIVLRESMELDSLEAIALMVRHGLGVSIIPVSHDGFLRFHRLKAVPLGRPPMSRQIGLAERVGNPKARVTAALMKALMHASARRRTNR